MYASGPEGGSARCLSGSLATLRLNFLCCSVSLHLKRSMGDSEPPDIFQHQSTGYFRTRGQETLYETYACVIHTNLHVQLHYNMRHSTISDLFLLTFEKSLRDSEPSDIILLGTRAPRDRILHEV